MSCESRILRQDHSWIKQVSLKSNGMERNEGHVNTEANTGAMQTTSQGTPGGSRSWRKQGRILSFRLWREHSPADILILQIWALKMLETKFVVLRHQVSGSLLWQPQETNTATEISPNHFADMVPKGYRTSVISVQRKSMKQMVFATVATRQSEKTLD